jgi:hypothetical protein
MEIPGQLEQIAHETPSQPKTGHGGACYPSYTGDVNRRTGQGINEHAT